VVRVPNEREAREWETYDHGTDDLAVALSVNRAPGEQHQAEEKRDKETTMKGMANMAHPSSNPRAEGAVGPTPGTRGMSARTIVEDSPMC
jgi:hypothetical protein